MKTVNIDGHNSSSHLSRIIIVSNYCFGRVHYSLCFQPIVTEDLVGTIHYCKCTTYRSDMQNCIVYTF